MNTFLKSLAFAALAMAATEASAIVVVSSDTVNAPAAAPGNPMATSTTGTVSENLTGSVVNSIFNRRDPFDGTPLDNVGVYTAVHVGSTATYEVAPSNFVGMVWGSPDDYNTLSFLDGNGNVLGTIDGTIAQPPVSIGFNDIVIRTPFVFEGLLFESTDFNAFEFANLSTSVIPLPASVIMFVSALGGLSALSSRRRKA